MTQGNSQSRWLLWLGFGGLLSLLAFACIYGLSTIREIGRQNERIRSDYVLRDHILQQLRSDLYLSGTHIRDLLLESDAFLAGQHRREFEATKSRIHSNRAAYAHILRPDELTSFQGFSTELDRYFDSLRPALAWNTRDRLALGSGFMKRSLLPERTLVVQLADQLSAINDRQLNAGNRQIDRLFITFERSLVAYTALTFLAGALLAGFSLRRLLRLERLSRIQLGELSGLSERLVEVQETERRALSRELHDEVGQAVSGLSLGIANIAAALSPRADRQILDQLLDLRQVAERTVASVRNMSLLLRPSMLDDLGLIPALQWQAREVSRTAKISVQVAADAMAEAQVSEHVKTCIYRVVQEALKNITRHANASTVDIELSPYGDRMLRLSIADNGAGFVPARDKGLGILGMEERVRHLNGSFHIHSEPGRGATLQIDLPAAFEACHADPHSNSR